MPALADSALSDLPPDKTNAIASIERALAEQGVKVVQDGPHFVRLFPKGAPDSLTNAPLRGADLAGSKNQETLSVGMIDFTSADLRQVLDNYGYLSQRTVLRPATLPAPMITLKTQGGLTREEAVYAIATVCALDGISVVDDGTKFVQVVPTAQWPPVQAHAPKAEPGVKLFDPKKVPSMGVSNNHWPLTETERLEQELRRAFYELMHLPDPAKRPTGRLLKLYAGLASKTVVPSKDFDGLPVWFHIETPLTRSELLYAIETTFVLHGLAIIPVDDHTIRLGRLEEVMRRVGNHLEYP